MRSILWLMVIAALVPTIGSAADRAATAPSKAPSTAPSTVPSTVPSIAPSTPPAVVFDPGQVPTSQGYHFVLLKMSIGGKTMPFPCGVYLPPQFFSGTAPLPVVVSLHNKYAIGSDKADVLEDESLGFALTHDRYDGRATGTRPPNPSWLTKDAPFVAVIPECPGGYLWESPEMAPVIGALVDQAIARCRGDRERVYLTGFSYGGSSTWVIAAGLPNVFAAIAPIDGRATKLPLETVTKLRDTAVYMVVGGSDRDFLPEAQRMRDALAVLPHPNFVSRIMPGGNHFCYAMVYADPTFWDWLLAQRRPHERSAPPKSAPPKPAGTQPPGTQPPGKTRKESR
jgi:hypothetical protein